jgi:hypothetical protein
MRAVYRKPEELRRTIAVPIEAAGQDSYLTVISPYLTPAALRIAMRAGWAIPDEEE